MYIPPKKIKELTEKKNRVETGLFIVEGEKNILEILNSDFEIVTLLGTKPFLQIIRNELLAYEKRHVRIICEEVSERILTEVGTLVSNNTGVLVARQKKLPSITEVLEIAKDTVMLLLDDIRDPGNLGTIVRTANWYGITHIVASRTTTDFYNPKVIGASMGSFTRICVLYVELDEFLKEVTKLELPIIAAHMEGSPLHTTKLPNNGFLLMGSESHGVSKDSLQYATHTVTIPRFGQAESLNVSVATGIILDAIKRA